MRYNLILETRLLDKKKVGELSPACRNNIVFGTSRLPRRHFSTFRDFLRFYCSTEMHETRVFSEYKCSIYPAVVIIGKVLGRKLLLPLPPCFRAGVLVLPIDWEV
jgi:hypothetical protein